jgi:hypothetical protein
MEWVGKLGKEPSCVPCCWGGRKGELFAVNLKNVKLAIAKSP